MDRLSWSIVSYPLSVTHTLYPSSLKNRSSTELISAKLCSPVGWSFINVKKLSKEKLLPRLNVDTSQAVDNVYSCIKSSCEPTTQNRVPSGLKCIPLGLA